MGLDVGEAAELVEVRGSVSPISVSGDRNPLVVELVAVEVAAEERSVQELDLLLKMIIIINDKYGARRFSPQKFQSC